MLTGNDLQQAARAAAAALPDVTRGRPFTPHLDVWKVGGKVFLIVTDDDPDLQIITVKVEPERGDALRRDHEAISVGRYLDKRHWISVAAGRRRVPVRARRSPVSRPSARSSRPAARPPRWGRGPGRTVHPTRPR